MAADFAELFRIGPQPADDPDEGGDDEQRGQDALGALGVEKRQRKFLGFALAQDDARDQETGNDEKDIDPGKAAGQQAALGVKGHHAQHRERAQAVDVGPEVMMAERPGRDGGARIIGR